MNPVTFKRRIAENGARGEGGGQELRLFPNRCPSKYLPEGTGWPSTDGTRTPADKLHGDQWEAPPRSCKTHMRKATKF